eukprot:364577-Chlamydomonas_euryale.AAC.10
MTRRRSKTVAAPDVDCCRVVFTRQQQLRRAVPPRDNVLSHVACFGAEGGAQNGGVVGSRWGEYGGGTIPATQLFYCCIQRSKGSEWGQSHSRASCQGRTAARCGGWGVHSPPCTLALPAEGCAMSERGGGRGPEHAEGAIHAQGAIHAEGAMHAQGAMHGAAAASADLGAQY